MEKFYSSKTLLKLAGGGRIPHHLPPLDTPLIAEYFTQLNSWYH